MKPLHPLNKEVSFRYKMPIAHKVLLVGFFLCLFAPEAYAQMFNPGKTIDLIEREITK